MNGLGAGWRTVQQMGERGHCEDPSCATPAWSLFSSHFQEKPWRSAARRGSPGLLSQDPLKPACSVPQSLCSCMVPTLFALMSTIFFIHPILLIEFTYKVYLMDYFHSRFKPEMVIGRKATAFFLSFKVVFWFFQSTTFHGLFSPRKTELKRKYRKYCQITKNTT